MASKVYLSAMAPVPVPLAIVGRKEILLASRVVSNSPIIANTLHLLLLAIISTRVYEKALELVELRKRYS